MADARIERLLTTDEVVALTGRSAGAVKRLRLTGRLPFIPGRPVRFVRADVLAFLDAEKRQAETAGAGVDAARRAGAARAVFVHRLRQLRQGR